MPLFSKRVPCLLVTAFLTLTFTAPLANADVALEFQWWVDGNLAGAYSIPGTDIGNGMYNYAGSDQYFGSGVVNLTYNLTGKPDYGVGTTNNIVISGNLAVENLFPDTIDVQLLVLLPVVGAPLPTKMFGSAGIGLTSDGDGGSVTSRPGTPVWQGLADGAPVGGAALFFDPFSLANGGFGSNNTTSNFGIPTPIDGPPLTTSIGIDINFSLTTLDQASITSAFFAEPIPGPGGLVVLAAAGLVMRRRRRN